MKIFGKLLLLLALIAGITGCRGNKDGDNGDFAGDQVITEDLLNALPEEDLYDPDTNPEGAIGFGERFGEGILDEAATAALRPVLFAYDSTSLGGNELAKVDAAADHLRNNPRATLILEGHADERGSREYNLGLGERRALAVRQILVNYGIAAGRVQTRSFGEEQPAVFGHNESAWAQNRRVEFKVYR